MSFSWYVVFIALLLLEGVSVVALNLILVKANVNVVGEEVSSVLIFMEVKKTLIFSLSEP